MGRLKTLLSGKLLLGALILLVTICAASANAQTTGEIRHLVKSDPPPYTVISTVPPADYVWANCSLENFVPNPRPIEFWGAETDSTRSPYRTPTCPWRDGRRGDYRNWIGDFNPRSLNDLGVFTVRCSGIDASRQIPPCITVDGICGLQTICAAANTTRRVDHIIEFTVYNNPPTASINLSSGPLPGGLFPYDGTVVANAIARDPDGGTPEISWRAIGPRPGASANGAEQPDGSYALTFRDETAFGTWQVEAMVDDDQGERIRVSAPVEVVNQAPTPVITGPERVAFRNPIALSVSPDEDGGDYTSVRWEYLRPGGASYGVLSDVGPADINVSIPTDVSGVGIWKFRATVIDNEPVPLSGTTPVFEVDVFNKPPEISVSAAVSPIPEIGGNIVFNASAMDPDGGDVTLRLRIVQTPERSGVAAGFMPLTELNSFSYSRGTNLGDAGTWIFQIEAEDDEPEAFRGIVSEEIWVVVDAPPEAAIEGEERIGTLTHTDLVLSGEPTVDPDSPCPDDPMRCHRTLDSLPAREISDPRIAEWNWSITDVALDDFSDFYDTDIFEAFGVPDNAPRLEIPLRDLSPGLWTFQLDVEDAEGNPDYSTFAVEIIEENVNPIAIVTPPKRYFRSALGAAEQDIAVSASRSFDPDNFLTGDLPGIRSYEWTLNYGPDDCLPRTSARELEIFETGETIPNACLGVYDLELSVEDDDEPLSHFAETATSVLIGACEDVVCIDLPTNQHPTRVEFAEDTDVIILYHVDPLALTTFARGYFAKLEIFHSAAPTIPIFTSHTANVATDTLNPLLVFHWNGYWVDGRPEPGRYNIKISLIDDALDPTSTGFSDEEEGSILIEVDELSITETSDRYVSRRALEDESDTVSISYAIDGVIIPDRVEWRVFQKDAYPSGTVIANGSFAGSLSGSLDWNGRPGHSPVVARVDPVIAEDYVVEINAFRDAASLTGAVTYDLTIYDLHIEAVAASTADKVVVLVNDDDDNRDNAADFNQSFAAENDLIELAVTLVPESLEGSLVYSSSISASGFKLWSDTAKTQETVLGSDVSVAMGSSPQNIFVEGIFARPSDIIVTFTPEDETALTPTSLDLNMVRINVIHDTNNNYVVDTSDEIRHYAEFGLWDNAFRLPGASGGAVGSLYNNSGENQNFVGRDSRRFYYRVADPSRNTDPGTVETISAGEFEWYTLDGSGSHEDYPPTGTGRSLTLTETGRNTGVFASKAIMLVSDITDVTEPTHTGLSGGVIAGYTQANHRTRLAVVDGSTRVQYRSGVVGSQELYLTIPVMRRSPDARGTINVRVINFSNSATGLARTPRIFIDDTIETIKTTFATVGIRTNIAHNPSVDQIDLGSTPASGVALNSVSSFAIASADWQTLTPSADQSQLINAVRSVYPSTSANTNTLYVLVVRRLFNPVQMMSLNSGESFADTYTANGGAAALAARNFIFVASNNGTSLVASHEIGHMLIQPTILNEANGIAPGWANGGHFGGAQSTYNLMKPGFPAVTPSVTDSRRLWNDISVHQVQQIQRIRSSRFVD